MRVGVIGARLAGSYASLLLSQMGHEVLLLDPGTEREKPCGGGVTSKVLLNMAWFRKQAIPHTEIRTLRMIAPDGYSGDLNLKHPIHIFSRKALDSSLREAAEQAGTHFLPEKALRYVAQSHGWVILTDRQAHEVDYLIGADGATSSVRGATIGKFAGNDLSLALGFYLPGLYHPETVISVFQEMGFLGYLWSFPRVDHSSVGVLQWLPQANASDLRRRVTEFIAAHYPDAGSEMRFYAARIPCLSRNTLLRQRVCGQNWALLGDAAGFADAITAEGIYFALRSAELLAGCIHRNDPLAYEWEWRHDFGGELARAAQWRDRFYAGNFLFRPFVQRAVQMTRRSTMVRNLEDRFVSGSIAYQQLRWQLIWRSPAIVAEALLNKFSSSDHSHT